MRYPGTFPGEMARWIELGGLGSGHQPETRPGHPLPRPPSPELHRTMKLFPAALGLAVGLLASAASAQTCSLVADINLGTGDSTPSFAHSVGGKYLLFRADNGTDGNELFRWDATSGVVAFPEIRPSGSSFAFGFTTLNVGGVLTTVFAANDGTHGNELWVTDGSTVSLLMDINPGSTGSSPFDFLLHPELGVVFFQANDGVAGNELWRTDGTAAGTYRVADVNPGSAGGGASNLAVFGPLVVFGGDDGVNGRELWASAGFPGGTFLVADLNPGPASSNPRTFAELGDKLVFAATNAAVGTELFLTDGTLGGTSLLKNINPGSASSNASSMTTFQGATYFSADDGVNGAELWRTDGTSAGTSMLVDLRPGNFGSAPVNFTAAAGKLFFSAANSDRELYTSDGTAAGTQLVTEINPGGASASPDFLVPCSTGVYFEARGPSGSELYFSDGTAAGTTLVCDVYPGALSGNPEDLILCDGGLFFTADDATVGEELRHLALPGAYVQDLGQSGNGSRLAASFPVLGTSSDVTVTGAPAGSIGLLVMSAPNGGPASFLTDGTSVSWIDPLTYSILSIFSTPDLALSQPLPATPTLVGGQVHLQAWAIPAAGLPASTSNGLQLVLGF